mgnify:CR=1 FL=1
MSKPTLSQLSALSSLDRPTSWHTVMYDAHLRALKFRSDLHNRQVQIAALTGYSGSGKTWVASEYSKRLSHVLESLPQGIDLDQGVVATSVNWCNLNESDLVRSFYRSLAPSATSMEQALHSLFGEIGYRFLILNDFELAMLSGFPSQASVNLLSELVASIPAGNRLDILITSTRPLPDDWFPSIHVAAPKWSDTFLGTGSSRFHSYLVTLIENQKGVAQDFVPEPTVLAVNLLSRSTDERIKEVAHEVASQLQISQVWAESAHNSNRSEENQKRRRSEFLSILHVTLFESELFSTSDPRYLEAIFRLVNWASVDPGFDFWAQCADESLRNDAEYIGRKVVDTTYAFFRSTTGAPRLSHSSTLDLYPSNLNRQRDSDHRRFANLIRACIEREEIPKGFGQRLAIAAMRHDLRSTLSNRTFDVLSQLDAEHFSEIGLASHELAYAKHDFVAPWEGQQVRSRSYLSQWYQPPCLKAYSDPDRCIETGIVMFADAAYQGLDDWSRADQVAKSVHFTPAPTSTSSTSDIDYWFLIHGLAATMMYEVGPSSHSWAELSYSLSRYCIDIWAEAHRSTGRPDSHVDLFHSVETNAVLAAIKCFPARVSRSSFTDSSFEEQLDYVLDVHRDFFSRCMKSIKGGPRDLDSARELLVFARWDFLRNGRWIQGHNERPDWLSALKGILRMEGRSQEVVYALLQLRQNWLYSFGSEQTIKEIFKEIGFTSSRELELVQTEDSWARWQFEFARIWSTCLETFEDTSRRKVASRKLVRLSEKFEAVDSKAYRTCLWSAAFLNSSVSRRSIEVEWNTLIESDGQVGTHEARDCIESLLDGDRFYSIVNDSQWNQECRTTFCKMFGKFWQDVSFAPVMPAALSLRAQPYAYVPRA